jgi:putative CocE/NonD family hydrolase
MRVGDTLCANVFRPEAPGAYPVIMTLGPYGKDVHVSQFMPSAWEHIQTSQPDILAKSSCKYLVFETPDPEVWVPQGYVVVKIDSRGAGKTPGFLDVNSPAESRDLYDAIEWAGVQDWSSGRVGLSGVSYLAMNQWQVAALQPPSAPKLYVFAAGAGGGFSDVTASYSRGAGAGGANLPAWTWWPVTRPPNRAVAGSICKPLK